MAFVAFLFLGGGALIGGVIAGFLWATSGLRLYIVLVGGWAVVFAAIAVVFGATSNGTYEEGRGLGFVIFLGLNLIGWSVGAVLGRTAGRLLRRHPEHTDGAG
jgi:hypothetical protein